MKSPVGRWIVWVLCILFSVAGVWISYALTLDHFETKVRLLQQTADEARADAAQPVAQPDAEDDEELPTPTPENGSAADTEKPEREKGFLDQVCEAFATSSCEEVALSEWGEIRLGDQPEAAAIPTAQLGLFYFIAVAWWLVLIGQVSSSRWWAHLPLVAVAAVGLAVSIFLDVMMFTQLEFWCPLCLVTHVLSLLLFVGVLLLWPRKLPEARTAPKSSSAVRVSEMVDDWPHWWMLAVAPPVILLTLAVAHLHLWRGYESRIVGIRLKTDQETIRQAAESLDSYKTRLARAEARRERAEKQYRRRYEGSWQHMVIAWQIIPRVDIPIEGRPSLGPDDARHTVVIFSGFQCPGCRRFEKWLYDTIVPLGPEYGGLRIVFKHWPISVGCNPYTAHDMHPLACDAALAAEAALMLGGNEAFWEMHELLVDHYPEWARNPAIFVEYARQIGLDPDAFVATMNGEDALARVKRDIEDGVNLGRDQVPEEEREWIKVNSTPSVFVNGKRLQNPGFTRAWRNILRIPPPPPNPPGRNPSSTNEDVEAAGP